MVMRILLILFIFTSTSSIAQQIYENKSGGYKIAVPEGWSIRTDQTTTDLLAPEDGPLDTWQEFLGVSISEANGLSLDESFDYFIGEDFPSYYPQFKIIKQGEEIINGMRARWVVYSFSNATQAGGSEVSATLNNLFYLILKDDVLYYLNGIAETSLYPKYEEKYLSIIRSFSL